MTFRDKEKRRYKQIKPKLFSKQAQSHGTFRDKSRYFCLADDGSAENLHKSIREEAIAYFRQRRIPWHEGLPDVDGNKKALPSNHLCCCQSMCVNCLAPMMRDNELLAKVFKVFLPEIDEVLPFAADQPLPDGSQPYLSFEYVGEKTHFKGETGWPQRGALCTSLDFSFLFRRYDGKRQLVLGEWKYTEEYKSCKLPSRSDINQTRWNTYEEEFKIWKSRKPELPDYEVFFVEPFYQLMRQTLLAQKMEREKELQADIVVHVHVSPKANNDLAKTFTSPTLDNGSTVTDAWKTLAPKNRFLSICSEDFLMAIERVSEGARENWAQWLLERYGWWRYQRI